MGSPNKLIFETKDLELMLSLDKFSNFFLK